MNQYSLTSLLKLRECLKVAAETELREAVYKHALEQEKLVEIKTSLRDTISARTKLQQSFFLKARQHSCNKREITCHVSSRDKHLLSENSLKITLAEQQETVNMAIKNVEIAKTHAIDAERDLKLIEKHHDSWALQLKRQKRYQRRIY